jgi:hypothetical protein
MESLRSAIGSLYGGWMDCKRRLQHLERKDQSFFEPIIFICIPHILDISRRIECWAFTRTAAASRLGQRLQGSPSPTLWTGGASFEFGHLSRRHFRFHINER